MRSVAIACWMLCASSVSVHGAPDDGLVACWDFDEGAGDILHDRSGRENHGKIRGAEWFPSGKGHALNFDGEDDYVDCGRSEALDITGPVTVQAWVHPTAVNRGEPGICGKSFDSYALTYYGNAYWYISSGGNNAACPLKMDVWTHIAGTFDGTTLRIYCNGEEMQSKASRFKEVRRAKNFLIGCIAEDIGPDGAVIGSRGFFPGLVDGVRVHSRALAPQEVLHYYNLEAEQKGLKPIAVSGTHRFLLEPFFYPDEEKAILSVSFRWALPLPDGEKVAAELAPAGQDAALQSRALDPGATRLEDEAEFSLKGLAAGEYELRAVLVERDGSRKAEGVRFRLPLDRAPLPGPEVHAVPPLADAILPPRYKISVAAGGGISVEAGGRTWAVESSYSYPNGGENRLAAAAPDGEGEACWKVAVTKVDDGTYRVDAQGQYYTVARQVEVGPSRILVKDTFRNTSSDVVGIIISNHVRTAGMKGARVTLMGNPSVFVGVGGGGLGLVALDDLYQIQQRTTSAGGRAAIIDEHFGLDKGASCAIEWAIYPTATSDYYDFINQVRKDEGLSGRVEGAFAFVDRRTPPSKELIELKNLSYASIGCLGYPPDDPTVSLEGWEFTEYPGECAALKKTFAETKQMHAGVKVMFHVAHSLYATSKPADLFGDSRAVDASGRQFHYGPDDVEYYGNYFARERFAEGWRWWLFYPTLENSFGKAMVKATDFMVGELGATGIWADGFFVGYVEGGYSHDRWDGHSVTIDPKTRLVARKKHCVTFGALPVLKRVMEIIGSRGGVVVTNGDPGPRSVWRTPHLITSCETGGGDQRPIGGLHLGRTVTPLGNPSAIKNQRDVYRDILTKLDHGALYFWYGDQDLMKHKTLVEHMYPITFESIHAGVVRGRERIITRKSGVYGWPGDPSLHSVHLYDGRGELTRNDFVSTIDDRGARTEVVLKENESAAIVRLPIALEGPGPINARVLQYDRAAIRISLNGAQPVQMRIGSGEFPVVPSARYMVTLGSPTGESIAGGEGLVVPLDLKGPADLTIAEAK